MDAYGVIDFQNERATLFVPKLDNYYKIWMTVLDLDEYKKKYPLIEDIQYTDSIEDFFKNL